MTKEQPQRRGAAKQDAEAKAEGVDEGGSTEAAGSKFDAEYDSPSIDDHVLEAGATDSRIDASEAAQAAADAEGGTPAAKSKSRSAKAETASHPDDREPFDLVVRGKRVLTSAGIAEREVGIRAGKVHALRPLGVGLVGRETIELAEDEVLLPGLVDTHVHVNEPGRTEWEGFDSATRAAAAGGVTTIIDMPLNSIPPTVSVDALEQKRAVARDQAFVDVGFWGGAVPGNTGELRALHDAGVFGFKCFLLHSGVDEFPPLDADEMEADLREISKYDAMLIVHAEDSRAISRAPQPWGDQYQRFLHSRPRGAENLAIAEVIERARWANARAHILHLSSSDALPMIRSARRDGVKLTVETCPHYLVFTAEEIPDGATTHKCCPPIREESNREALWQGLIDGTIDCIVSDHSPSTADLKDERRLRCGVGWDLVAAARPFADLDRGAPPRPRARAGRELDEREAGAPRRAHPQGAHRAGLRRRLRDLRRRRRLRRRREEAAPQEPHHPVRRPSSGRRRAPDLPAGAGDRSHRAARPAADAG